MKGTLLLPHVSCKTSGNCIHVSYSNTYKWESLIQCKDTQKDVLKNCYPHSLWDFTVFSIVWSNKTKNMGKTPGREGEGNRREAKQQVSLCRQAQEESPGVALCQRRTLPLQEKKGRRRSKRSTVCACALCGTWGEKIWDVNNLGKASQFPSIVRVLKCAVLWAWFFFFFLTSYIYLYQSLKEEQVELFPFLAPTDTTDSKRKSTLCREDYAE